MLQSFASSTCYLLLRSDRPAAARQAGAPDAAGSRRSLNPGEGKHEGEETQGGQDADKMLVRCTTWGQLRRHLRTFSHSRFPGGTSVETGGEGAQEGLADDEVLHDRPAGILRELLDKSPRLPGEIAQWLLDNPAEGACDAHIAFTRCLAMLRKRQRQDLWSLLSKDLPAPSARASPHVSLWWARCRHGSPGLSACSCGSGVQH